MAMRIGKDLVAASATPLVLGILAEGESYGYAILRRINEVSDGQLEWTEGMLYPLLHRLERLGQLESVWREGESGRRRKHYRITSSGRAALAEQQQQWAVITAAFAAVRPNRGDKTQRRLPLPPRTGLQLAGFAPRWAAVGGRA